MSLLRDFWAYCSCYEIPRNYSIWAGLGLLSATVNRKVYVRQGDIVHHANMYITLVGEQGGKKSTAKDFARDIFVELFPDAPVGAAMQSREDIVKFLASDESTKAFKNEDGLLVEYHPYAFFINELKNFLSFNPQGMIEFLTDIYDRKFFDARTLKRGLEPILNPSLTLLACETPGWITDKLKANIIAGGFSRRMVYVYEVEDPKLLMETAKPRPVVTPEARAALMRVREQVKVANKVVGEFKWNDEAGKMFDKWYLENRRTLPDDPVMRGYRRTKDVQLLKACMLLAASKPDPQKIITTELLEEGLALLDLIEVNMPKLSVAAGRNELALPQQALMDYMIKNSGRAAEKDVMWALRNEFPRTMDLLTTIRFLKDAGQLTTVFEKIPGTTNNRAILVTKDYLIRQASSKPRPSGEGTK